MGSQVLQICTHLHSKKYAQCENLQLVGDRDFTKGPQSLHQIHDRVGGACLRFGHTSNQTGSRIKLGASVSSSFSSNSVVKKTDQTDGVRRGLHTWKFTTVCVYHPCHMFLAISTQNEHKQRATRVHFPLVVVSLRKLIWSPQILIRA